ncbi:MAG: deoxyribonuclease IV [Planctomycetota bacterium]
MPSKHLFGSHLSIAGGMHKAVASAVELELGTVQVFTKNQQQWKVPPLEEEAVAAWRSACDQAGYVKTVSHASYLINLATPDAAAKKKAASLFAEEVRRCDTLGIPYLVIHPGAHMGDGVDVGIERIVQMLDATLANNNGETIVCLESTAGQGSSVGHELEHLAAIIEQSKHADRLAVCLDTAHLFAAGYDFRGRKYQAFVRKIKGTIGVDRVKVWHLNDSKKPLDSRVDRHEHIGLGTIGDDGFRPLMRDKRWHGLPMILETPKAKHDDGRDWDAVNVERLKGLAKR